MSGINGLAAAGPWVIAPGNPSYRPQSGGDLT